jgi:hypothetical protein
MEAPMNEAQSVIDRLDRQMQRVRNASPDKVAYEAAVLKGMIREAEALTEAAKAG